MNIAFADWIKHLSKRTDHLYLNDGDPYVPHNFNGRIMHIKLNYTMPRLYERGIYDDISCELGSLSIQHNARLQSSICPRCPIRATRQWE